MSTAKTQSTYCRICEAACGLLVDRDANNQLQRIRPDRIHPVSKGFVCAKGTRFLEVADHPDRLLYPMQRQADGRYTPLAWSQAMTFLAGRLQSIPEPLSGQHRLTGIPVRVIAPS